MSMRVGRGLLGTVAIIPLVCGMFPCDWSAIVLKKLPCKNDQPRESDFWKVYPILARCRNHVCQRPRRLITLLKVFLFDFTLFEREGSITCRTLTRATRLLIIVRLGARGLLTCRTLRITQLQGWNMFFRESPSKRIWFINRCYRINNCSDATMRAQFSSLAGLIH